MSFEKRLLKTLGLRDGGEPITEEGFLDAQFTELQHLQDENNPNFVSEVVSLFFEDSERLLNELSRTLDQQIVDFRKVDAHVHQLKGSSASIGAQRVKNVCLAFRSCCDENNLEGCLGCLQQVRQECYLVKNKLDALFRLEQQILAAGGAVPIMSKD
ncbi:histidine-containing phosphotransfer protein 1-like isoform X1 [Ananas comosus]|nr:histidine-containing phosphotransfer protein 1-like isoform X1 [Ananas comosus]OAY66625.1 Histidine-containing phosphotransfer protein 1 [Ananas comosus]